VSEILDYDYSFKSSGIRVGDDPRLEELISSNPVGVILPLRQGVERSGIFEMSFDPIVQIRNNLKNLILTNHFERLGNPLYGANLRPLCTEYSAIDNFDAAVMDRIQQAVLKFMPIVELDDFSLSMVNDTDPALLRIDMKIKYNVPKISSMGNVISLSFTLI
jgi:phage baseplate assembly protein W